MDFKYFIISFVVLLYAEQPVFAQQEDSDSGGFSLAVLPWPARVSGFLDSNELVPMVENNAIDVVDTLRLTGSAQRNWILEVALSLGGRSRLIAGYSRVGHNGVGQLSETITFGNTNFTVNSTFTSILQMQESHGLYNMLLVNEPGAELGFLLGAGYMQFTGLVSEPVVGTVTAEVNIPYPLVGGSIRINPRGRIRFYGHAIGFPRVSFEEHVGKLADLQGRIEVFLLRNVGVIASYRSYDLSFEEVGTLVLGLRWNGFGIGALFNF